MLFHVQVSIFFLPALVSRAKISEPNGCRSGIATFTFQCGVSVSLPFPSDPVIPPQYGHLHIPFAFFCAFLPRPLAIPSLPQTQFQPACRSASGAQPLLWAQSPCLVRALSRMDLTFPWEAPAFAPIFAQRDIELQAVPSLRQSTLRHALVSRLLILLKAAGDCCPILALADEDPWMGWQLVCLRPQ